MIQSRAKPIDPNAGFRLLALLSLGALTLAIGACNIFGPAFVLISGPPKIDALYELDPDRTYVVFVDDMRSRMPKRSLRAILSRATERELIRNEALPAEQVIPGAVAYTVIQDESWGDRMSIVDIGRRVGADVIIYVTIDRFQLTRDGISAWPVLSARVKVLDTVDNKRLWPGNTIGHMINVEPLILRMGDMPSGLSERAELEERLSDRFGVALAQVFYEYFASERVAD